MFSRRFFGGRYFGASYFGGEKAKSGGLFGPRYFGVRFFGPRYFPPGEAAAEAPPEIIQPPSFGSGFRIVEHGIAQGALLVVNVLLIPGVASGEQLGITFIPGTATGEIGDELMFIFAEAA